MVDELEGLLHEISVCCVCADDLPLGPRPVVRAASGAKILIIGQAPGTRVHESGIPWNDPSGERLREWMDVADDVFYDPSRIAIMPMGFCYPGRQDKGGDKPPRPECAPLWHDRLRALLPHVELTLLVGSYAQKHYLGAKQYKTMTETVRHGGDFAPELFPLPHPSWRSTGWLKKNPWFGTEVLPKLRQNVVHLLA